MTANAPVATVLGSIPAFVGTEESEGRQISSVEYSTKKNIKKPKIIKYLEKNTFISSHLKKSLKQCEGYLWKGKPAKNPNVFQTLKI
jgi:hypothetical protein